MTMNRMFEAPVATVENFGLTTAATLPQVSFGFHRIVEPKPTKSTTGGNFFRMGRRGDVQENPAFGRLFAPWRRIQCAALE
jgi:hypothetical protein